MGLLAKTIDFLCGGGRRRLCRAAARLERAVLVSEGARDCGPLLVHTLRLAARLQPADARRLYRAHGERVSDEELGRAVSAADRVWIETLAGDTNADLLHVAFGLARRLGMRSALQRCAANLEAHLARTGTPDALIVHLDQCRTLGLADRGFLENCLRGHLQTHSLNDSPAWKPFLAGLPADDLPRLFAVHLYLDRAARAAALASTAAEKQQALACCLCREDEESVLAGLPLAEELADVVALRELHRKAGALRFAQEKWANALDHFTRANCPLQVSQCHERLGNALDALRTCPPSEQERLVSLVGPCLDVALHHCRETEYLEALKALATIQAILEGVVQPGPEVTVARGAVQRHRQALLRSARADLTEQEQRLPPAGRRPLYLRWGAIEEAAGDRVRAAQLAEEAGDFFKASLLWESDAQYGEALRALGRDGDRREVLARMATLAERGGDLDKAAGLYERCQRWEDASRAYAAADRFADAARCLHVHLGDERAAASADYARLMTRAGLEEDLLRLWIKQAENSPGRSPAVEQLRKALAADSPVRLRPALRQQAEAALAARLQTVDRQRFDRDVQRWVADAKQTVLGRYAPAWGMDLGTSKCAVALYDIQQRGAVVCPWHGGPQFPSVLAIEVNGREVVGATEEELLADTFRGAVVRSKRKMGSRTTYQIGDRRFRPEEVAARLLAHGRGIVESFLRQQVRERVRVTAEGALGDVPPEWLDEATSAPALEILLPKAVVTVPAYFAYKQKQATHDACTIAGIELLRLVHEPAAACLAAGTGRTLQGRVAVVDLGAGTLDISTVDLGDGIYEVTQVFGNNEFGSSDFDALVAEYLLGKLKAERGIPVEPKTLLDRRVRVAAEYLKIQLSSAETAMYTLAAFGDHGTVQLELSRPEFEKLLADRLRQLSSLCGQAAGTVPDYLLLVGAPMLSPLLRACVEKVFRKKATTLADPRTAVACGAAVQAAVLTNKADVLLLDMVPFSLGVRIVEKQSRQSQFNVHIKKGTKIPAGHKQVYSTLEDNQPGMSIEVFQGESPDPEKNLKVGQFDLTGIAPAKAGVPKVEVSFDIDASSVLTVTAHDLGTGRKKSIQIVDTTMLSPAERQQMRARFESVQRLESGRDEVTALLRGLRDLLDQTTAADARRAAAAWKGRFESHQKTATGFETTAADERGLYEMFNQSAEAENRLALACDRYENLARALGELESAARETEAVADLLSRARDIEHRLRQTVEELGQVRRQFSDWDTLLAGLSLRIDDPETRFLASHAARAYPTAIAAFEGLQQPPRAALVERYLDCLAHVRDRPGYRRGLARHAASLGLRSLDFSRLAEFGRSLAPALADLHVTLVDGRQVRGCAFLVSPTLLATCRALLVQDSARQEIVPGSSLRVRLGGQERPVQEIILPGPEVGLALVRLAQPIKAAPVRLGYTQLLELGEPVLAVGIQGAEGGEGTVLVERGIVNRFRVLSGTTTRLVEAGVPARAGLLGGPLLNDWGEVIGVIARAASAAAQAAGESEPAERCVEAVAVEPLHEWRPHPWQTGV